MIPTHHHDDPKVTSNATAYLEVDDQFTRDDLEDLVPYPVAAFADLARNMESSALVAFHLDPTAELPRTRVLARRAAQAMNAEFVAAAHEPGEELVLEFDDGTVRGVATGLTGNTFVGPWLTAYWWARISHNTAAQEVLARFSAFLLTRGDGVFDPHLVLLVEALKAREAGDPVWRHYATAGAERVGAAHPERRDEAQFLDADLFGLLLAIGDQTEFTGQLERAVANHRTYFTSTPELASSLPGYVSIPLLAVCSIAVDEGMTIDIGTGYLPQYLLDHPDWMFTITAGEDSLT